MTIKILVIEDAHPLRKDILEMLSFEGFDVRGAENGVLGVQAAREFHPDLIVCDIMMPEMDGYGVLTELQSNPAEATIPFVFLTARTDKGDVRQGMELGANDYLTKPFTANELINTVRTQLEKRRKFDKQAQVKLDALRDNIILALPHELRTPLTGILGFADILATDSYDMEPNKIAEMAQYIHSAALRLFRLTENYLAYSQLQVILTDPARIQSIRQYSTEDPRFIVENVVIQKAQDAHREDDVRMNVDADVSVNIYEENLRKIVEELVDNALKFSQPGSLVEVSTHLEGDYYVLTVVDHGRGIPAENLRDFGAYSQFGRKWYEQQGSGFGLAIVQRLVELHGGEVDVDSIPDRETRVTVKLPLQGAVALEGRDSRRGQIS